MFKYTEYYMWLWFFLLTLAAKHRRRVTAITLSVCLSVTCTTLVLISGNGSSHNHVYIWINHYLYFKPCSLKCTLWRHGMHTSAPAIIIKRGPDSVVDQYTLLPRTHAQGVKQSVLSVCCCHKNRQIATSRHLSDS